MDRRLSILYAGEADARVEPLFHALCPAGYTPIWQAISDEESLPALLSARTWDLVVASESRERPSPTLMTMLQQVQQHDPSLPFIAVGETDDIEMIVDLMKAGMDDYVGLENPARFVRAVEAVLPRSARGHRPPDHDVTQQMVCSLYTSRVLLQGVLDHTPSVISVRDQDGRFLLVNHQLEKLTSIGREHIIGRRDSEVFLPEQVKYWHMTDRQVLSSGEPLHLEETMWLNGQFSTFISSKFPIYDEQGHIYAIGVISTDITERKQAEESLRQSQQRYLEITDLISNAIYSYQVEPDGSLVREWGVETFDKITGYCSDEIALEDWQKLMYPDDIPVMLHRFELFQERQPVTSEYRIVTKGGEVRWLRDHGRPVWDDETGRLVRIYGAVQDITDYRRAEAELAAYRERLEELVAVRTEALQQSEESLRALLNAIQETAFLMDRDGTIQQANETAARRLGTTTAGLVGENIFSFLSPELAAERRKYMEQVIRTARPVHFEDQREGFYLDNTMYPVLEKTGQVLHMAVFAIDLSERKQAEQALRESEQRHRLLAHYATDMISRHAPDGTYLYASQASKTLLGYDPEELVGQCSSDFFHPDDLETTSKTVSLLLETREVKMGSYRIRHKDGHYIWFESTGQAICDPVTNEVREIIAVSRDVTARKHMEEALRESQTLLKGVLDHAPAAISIRDLHEQYLLVNYRLLQAFGLDRPEQMIGKTIDDFFPPEVCEVARADDQYVMTTGTVMIQEYTTPLPDGEHTVLAYRFPIYDNEGQLYAIGSISTDITERKQAEEQIRHLNEILIRRAHELEAANAELETFSHSVAHDLRSPLWSIDMMAEALLDEYAGSLDAQGQDYLARIRSNTQRMVKLTDALLTLSRVTRSELVIEEVNLSAMAHEIVADLRQREPERPATMTIAPDMVLPGDSRLLHTLLENLLSNAWKFTSKQHDTRIVFGAYDDEGRRVSFVQDNGAGFDMARSDRLFSPFQRLHDKSEFPGTGIGLATVFRIVQRHGGQVWASGTRGEGATFFFTLGEREGMGGTGAERGMGHRWSEHPDEGDPPSSRTPSLPPSYHLNHESRSIQRSRDLLQTVFDTINDGLVLIDQYGIVQAINRAGADLFGFPPKDLVWQSWAKLCRPDGSGSSPQRQATGFPGEWVVTVIHDGHPRQQRESYTGSDGEQRLLSLRAVPFRATDETRTDLTERYVVLHIVDITEYFKVESLMIDHERLATGRKLSEIIAHEVNTPLQTLLFSLELMSDASSEEQALFVQRTRGQIERIGTILHHLKDMYHPAVESHEPFNLSHLIEQMVHLLGSKLQGQHIQIQQHLAEAVPMVYGSVDQIHEALLNVLFNAIEAMPEGGNLEVRCSVVAPEVVVEIADTGHGIPPEVQSRIFDPFFTTKMQGSGLGLFVAKRIVAWHGGRIQVESQPGRGTTCRIALPLDGSPS